METKCTCERPDDNTCDYCEQQSSIQILKEAAERYSSISFNRQDLYDGFIEGAKWQQEQDKNKYSEKEVIELLEYIRKNFYDTGTKWHSEPDTDFTSKELVEQFKKK
jgi:hypothetical protein